MKERKNGNNGLEETYVQHLTHEHTYTYTHIDIRITKYHKCTKEKSIRSTKIEMKTNNKFGFFYAKMVNSLINSLVFSTIISFIHFIFSSESIQLSTITIVKWTFW